MHGKTPIVYNLNIYRNSPIHHHENHFGLQAPTSTNSLVKEKSTMSATTAARPRRILHRTEASKLALSVVDMPLVFQELITHRDVSELISPIAQKHSFGFKGLNANEVLVGAGIGVKAIASFPTNFKIMVTHGEVQLRHYLRLDEDSDLLSPSAIKTLTAGVPLDLVADIVSIEAVKGMSSLAIAAFIYL
jgi:hypothetical protein